MDIRCNNIHELFDAGIIWANSNNNSNFYGSSGDDGKLCLRKSSASSLDKVYTSISITSVNVPEDLRGKGLYSKFLADIEELHIFGAREHGCIKNERLKQKYIREGLIENHSGHLLKIMNE